MLGNHFIKGEVTVGRGRQGTKSLVITRLTCWVLILLRVDHAIMPMTLHTMSAVFLANLVSNKLNRKKKYPENEAAISTVQCECASSLVDLP